MIRHAKSPYTKAGWACSEHGPAEMKRPIRRRVTTPLRGSGEPSCCRRKGGLKLWACGFGRTGYFSRSEGTLLESALSSRWRVAKADELAARKYLETVGQKLEPSQTRRQAGQAAWNYSSGTHLGLTAETRRGRGNLEQGFAGEVGPVTIGTGASAGGSRYSKPLSHAPT